jgi:hypothetical protein
LGVFLLASAAQAQRVPTGPGRVLASLETVEYRYVSGRYTHTTRIDERSGLYEWDCSAMVGFLLRRATPRAFASLGRPRPLAVDFYRAIVAAPEGTARGPWLRVPRLADARPGDVLAWPRPRWFPSRNTGHVAFVVEAPRAVPGGYLVRIADATTVPHQDDTRRGRTGLGRGTLLVTVDAAGRGTGYGWCGAYCRDYVVPTPVVIGRALR